MTATADKHEIRANFVLGRYRHKFFDQVGHQTTCASMGNKHFIMLNNVIIRPTKIMQGVDKNWAHF